MTLAKSDDIVNNSYIKQKKGKIRDDFVMEKFDMVDKCVYYVDISSISEMRMSRVRHPCSRDSVGC